MSDLRLSRRGFFGVAAAAVSMPEVAFASIRDPAPFHQRAVNGLEPATPWDYARHLGLVGHDSAPLVTEALDIYNRNLQFLSPGMPDIRTLTQAELDALVTRLEPIYEALPPEQKAVWDNIPDPFVRTRETTISTHFAWYRVTEQAQQEQALLADHPNFMEGIEILRSLSFGGEIQRLAAIKGLVDGKLTYSADQMGRLAMDADHYQTLHESLRRGAGDCDDYSIAYMTAIAMVYDGLEIESGQRVYQPVFLGGHSIAGSIEEGHAVCGCMVDQSLFILDNTSVSITILERNGTVIDPLSGPVRIAGEQLSFITHVIAQNRTVIQATPARNDLDFRL